MDKAQQTIRTMWEEVFARRPELKDIYSRFGAMSVFEYSSEHLGRSWMAPNAERSEQLLVVLHELVSSRLSSSEADGLVSQLRSEYSVSTVDHHGPLSHPFFLNSNLLLTFWAKQKSLRYIPVLSNANVSLNNSSFPRGFLLRTAQGQQRLPIISSDTHMQPVFTAAAYTREALVHLQTKAELLLGIDLLRKEALSKHIQALFEPGISKSSYSEQITNINFQLWQLLGEKWQEKLPTLITIEQESVTEALLMRHHLKSESILNSLLFDTRYHELIERLCSGIQGAFDVESKRGTFLFWGINPKNKHRIGLFRQGGTLLSEDKSFRLQLDPESVQAALEQKKIIPGMLLTFFTLSFYYGLECFGGFSQIDYLAKMKSAYLELLSEFGAVKDAALVQDLRTDKMIEGVAVALIKTEQRVYLASSVDLLVHGDAESWKYIVQAAQGPLGVAMDAYIHELHKIIVGKESSLAVPEGFTEDKSLYPAITLR